MFRNNILSVLRVHRYYFFGVALVFSAIFIGIFVQYHQPLQNGRLLSPPTLSLSFYDSFSSLDGAAGGGSGSSSDDGDISGSSSSHIANAQTVPPLTVQQCERRGFPDGISTGRPPEGKGLLVVEKQVCRLIPVPGSFLPQVSYFNLPGNAIPTDFSVRVTGNIAIFEPSTQRWTSVQERTFQGAGTVYLNPGSYSVFETLPTRADLNTVANQPSRPNYGYVPAAYEGECRNVSIAAGQTKHCIIKNHPLPSKSTFPASPTGPTIDARPIKGQALLVFQKAVVNDDRGSARPTDFNVVATNNGRTISPTSASINTVTWGPFSLLKHYYYNISPGSYNVRESTTSTVAAGYLPTIYLGDSLTSTTNIRAGQTILITSISNDR